MSATSSEHDASPLRYLPNERDRVQEGRSMAARLRLLPLFSLPHLLRTVFPAFRSVTLEGRGGEGAVFARVRRDGPVGLVDRDKVLVGSGRGSTQPLFESREAFSDFIAWERTAAVRVGNSETFLVVVKQGSTSSEVWSVRTLTHFPRSAGRTERCS